MEIVAVEFATQFLYLRGVIFMLDPPLQNEVDGPRISQNPSEVRPEPYHPNRLTNLPSRTAGILSILHSLLLGKN